jgi:hypothetical protein
VTHTQPTLSYGHGWLFDGDRTSGGIEGDWSGTDCTPTVEEGDFLKVTRSDTNASATHATGLWVDTTVYPKIRFRYKCSNANVLANIYLMFTDGNQTVLNNVNSTSMTTAVVNLTPAKTITYVMLNANTANGTVYYDFVLIYKGDFTIPNCASGIDWTPKPRYAQYKPWGMAGNHTQNGGSDSAEWNLTCDLTHGTWTRTGGTDHLLGEVFLDIIHHSSTEPWQWFNSGLGQCKVTLDNPLFHRAANNNKLDWTITMTLREKRLSSADCTHETYITRYHLDLV